MKDGHMERRTLGEFNPHFQQLRAVAARAGTDLGEAVHEGRITTAGYAQAITRCRGANCLHSCLTWLQAPEASSALIPEFCANREIFEQLRRKR